MAGYTRQSNGQIVNGNTADASHFNNEFNKLQEAFNVTTGHNHDGTAGGGARLVPGSLSGLNSNGMVSRINENAFAPRTLTGTTGQIAVANGDGVAGNPTFSLPDAMTFTGKTVTGGTFNDITIGSGSTINKNPVITLSGDFTGSATMTGLGDVSISGALAGMQSNGIAVRTGAGTYAPRTLIAPAAGVSITNGNGVAGNPTFALSNDLASLEGISSSGFAARVDTDTWAPRIIEGTQNQIIVDDGNGVGGNPTIRFASAITFPGSIRVTTGGADITGSSFFRSDVTFSNLFSTRGIGDAASNRVLTLTNAGVGIFQASPASPIHIGSSTFTQDAAIQMHTGNGSQNRAWRMGVRYGGTAGTGINYGFYISDLGTGGGDRFYIDYQEGRVHMPNGGLVSRPGNVDTLIIQNPQNTSSSAGCQVFYNGQAANAYTRVMQAAGTSLGAFQIVNTNYTQLMAEFRQNGSAFNPTGTWGATSDIRVKEHIETSRGYLEDLNKLRVVKYALKEDKADKANKLGFIAQEVEEVFPQLVETGLDINGDELKSVKTSVLIPMLVKAVQELTAEVNHLKDEIVAIQTIH